MTDKGENETGVVHELKAWPIYFEPLADGRKTFEARHDDRGFREGDRLWIREYDLDTHRYTGRELSFDVGFILTATHHALADDHVVMSLLPADDE